MILELCGLPGCGKTTLVREFKKAHQDSKVYTRQEIVGNNILIYKIWHRAIGIGIDRLYPKGYYEKAFACQDFLDSFGNTDKRFMYKMLEQDRAFRLNKEKDMILDEGLFQGITSIPYDKNIMDIDKLKIVIEKIFDGELDYRVVRCRLDTDTVISRIRQRNRNDRYSNPDRRELEKLLEIKENNTDIVLQNLNIGKDKIYELDMSCDTSENIKKLFELIKK